MNEVASSGAFQRYVRSMFLKLSLLQIQSLHADLRERGQIFGRVKVDVTTMLKF